jgi:hypothetical protein
MARLAEITILQEQKLRYFIAFYGAVHGRVTGKTVTP